MQWSDFSLLPLFNLLLLIIVQCIQANKVGSNNQTNGQSCDPTCLRCLPQGCLKCPGFILEGTRRCVEACPSGQKGRLSTSLDYIGKICVSSASGDSSAVSALAGVCLGAALCLVVILGAAAYLHRRRARGRNVREKERRRFVAKLHELRPKAATLLRMLNDARRRVRDLNRAGDLSGEEACKPILSDLAKVLLLLNRSPEDLTGSPPEHWDLLLSWAEKVLKSYRPEERTEQLIDLRERDYSEPKITLSTFKPPPEALGTVHECRKLEEAEEERNSSSGKADSREYLNRLYYIEDGYLGFRPQDEITTEL